MNLDALDEVTQTTAMFKPNNNEFMELEIDKIFANPKQPRKNFEDIEGLAESIKKSGLIQPIAVTKTPQGYMIISGERRYQAHKYAGLNTIKVHIIEATDKEIQELSIVENIQRDDLTDYEKAKFIGELWASGAYKQKSEIAEALGKTPAYISKCFSTLRLDDEIIKDLEEGSHPLGLSILEELGRVKDKPLQREIYLKLISKEINRDGIARCISDFNDGKIFKPKKSKKTFVCQGFGTVNDMGNFISLSGDLEGRVAIDTEDFVKQSNNFNYKITIEEI